MHSHNAYINHKNDEAHILMLTRDQVRTLIKLRNRGDGPFATPLHDLAIKFISDYDEGPNSQINIALRHAVLGEQKDIDILVKMVEENPRLLLQAGNVMTRGGVSVTRTTLYEFFLGEGDPDAAKIIEFGFAKIPNGENERRSQYERYKPSIEAMAKQIESKQPEYDLRPLFEIIKKSTPADITAALE